MNQVKNIRAVHIILVLFGIHYLYLFATSTLSNTTLQEPPTRIDPRAGEPCTPSQNNRIPALVIDDGRIVVPIHIATLRGNKTGLFPAGTCTSYIVEVGMNSHDNIYSKLDEAGNEKACFLGFEPIIDKYGRLLQLNWKVDTFSPLASIHPRGVVMPFAIVNEAEPKQITFSLSPTDGCSSLLDLNPEAEKWAHWCFPKVDERLIPGISLETAFGWLEGPITHLKIDAQGYDLEVFKSTRSKMSLVEIVQIETVGDKHPALYQGQVKCTGVVKQMEDFGYELYDVINMLSRTSEYKPSQDNCQWEGHAERDMYFRKKKSFLSL
jgi:hypothetical protein